MQVLFGHHQEGRQEFRTLEKLLFDHIRDTGRAYLFHFLFLVEVADAVGKEAVIKAAKYLPSEEDRQFNQKFYANSLAASLRADDAFRKCIERERLEILLDSDMIRLAYNRLKSTSTYQDYLASTLNGSGKEGEEERRIALSLFEEVVWTNEDLNQYWEDVFPSWDEDAEIVVPRVQAALRQWKPGQTPAWDSGQQELPQESREFVSRLLRLSLEHERELEALVAPKLDNWELERVSLMDRILIRMALTELLYCETIPVKVSINEYIDISKTYSTPKSKDFINGVLDNLMKTLREEGRIRKIGRGLVE